MKSDQSKDLSERQLREQEYYNEHTHLSEVPDITFDPIELKERRPWNSYWTVYEEAVKSYNNSEQKLLDFGCGIGVQSVRFAKIGYQVYGFDISEEQIKVAQELAMKYEVADRTNFSLQTAEKLNYEDNYFDIIVGFDILHHIEISQSINEVFRILKPGGLVIFREMIEAPFLDKIRNFSFMKKLVSNEVSHEKHITHDEKKLDKIDVKIILEKFPNYQIRRFVLLSRFRRFFPIKNEKRSSKSEIFDYYIFKIFPFLKPLGGAIVFLLRK